MLAEGSCCLKRLAGGKGHAGVGDVSKPEMLGSSETSHVTAQQQGDQLYRAVPAIPASSADWLHEINHDGFRIMALRVVPPRRREYCG